MAANTQRYDKKRRGSEIGITFKELRKLMQQSQQSIEDSKALEQLKTKLYGKPFYDWYSPDHKNRINIKSNRNCCFNHIIGLPKKADIEHPIYDYELIIYRCLLQDSYLNSKPINLRAGNTAAEKAAKNKLLQEQIYSEAKCKHCAVIKASGLGITELVIRWIVWMCLRNDELKGSQVIVFTGPRIALANSIILRMKDLLKPHGILFTDKETVLNLNGVRIEAFPSHHADSARGLPSVSIIFADELAFFPDKEKDNVMDIMLRNVPKSNPWLIAVSTPNKPGDVMDTIMKEPFETSVWKKVYLDYLYGVDRIYTKEEIEKVKNTRSFAREFCLQFTGLEGNVFSQMSIDKAVELGKKYNPEIWRQDVQTVISLDPAFGSPSKFGIVITQFIDQRIVVIFVEEYERPNFSAVINIIWKLKQKCGNVSNIIVDSANPEVWQAFKQEFNERSDEQYIRDTLANCRKRNVYPEDRMFVVPKSFALEGKQMLEHCVALMDNDNGMIAIPEKHDKLILSLRSATAKEWKLDKSETVHADIMDAFRLNLSFYRISK
jgi:hypothetical protein